MGWRGVLCGFGLVGALGCSLLLGAAAGGQTVGNPGPAAPVGVETGSAGVEALRRLIDTGHAEEALKQSAAMRARVGGSGGEAAALSRMDGMAYYALGQLRAADGAFADALKERPDDVESAEMRGVDAGIVLGRPADAIPLLEGAAAKLRAAARTQGTSDAKQGMIAANQEGLIRTTCWRFVLYGHVRRYDDARHALRGAVRVCCRMGRGRIC